jgi:hypothetical protein
LKEFHIISDAVPGGDGWLGQCCAKAGVTLIHDWRFKSLPPAAYHPALLPHFHSFHKVPEHQIARVHTEVSLTCMLVVVLFIFSRLAMFYQSNHDFECNFEGSPVGQAEN